MSQHVMQVTLHQGVGVCVWVCICDVSCVKARAVKSDLLTQRPVSAAGVTGVLLWCVPPSLAWSSYTTVTDLCCALTFEPPSTADMSPDVCSQETFPHLEEMLCVFAQGSCGSHRGSLHSNINLGNMWSVKEHFLWRACMLTDNIRAPGQRIWRWSEVRCEQWKVHVI